MLVDLLVYGLIMCVYGIIMWGLATVLNKMAFKTKPASKGAAWGLTILVFFLNFVVILAAKINLSPRNPQYMGEPLVFAWMFYSLLNRVKGGKS